MDLIPEEAKRALLDRIEPPEKTPIPGAIDDELNPCPQQTPGTLMHGGNASRSRKVFSPLMLGSRIKPRPSAILAAVASTVC